MQNCTYHARTHKMNPNNAIAITEHEHLFTTNQQVAYPCYVEGRVVC